jgi:hypothetical protein
MGKATLRAVIGRPDLELVGLYVYNPKKVGVDAGVIAGGEPIGVLATDRIEDILGLEADIVIHSPRIQPPYTHHNAEIERLLASGKNVISINGHTKPDHWGETYVRGFVDACEKGQSSLLGAGLNPGFAAEKIAAVASGLCIRIDHIRISERVDTTAVRSADYVFDVLGFGSTPGDFDPNDPDWPPGELLGGMFSEVVADLVARLGCVLERVESDHTMHPARRDLEVAAGRIAAGTIARTHWQWHGLVEGRRLVTLSIEWSMEPDPAASDRGHPLWRIEITGDPCVDIQVELHRREDDRRRGSPEQDGLAGAVLNAIPFVLAARPGILCPPNATPWQAPSARSKESIE